MYLLKGIGEQFCNGRYQDNFHKIDNLYASPVGTPWASVSYPASGFSVPVVRLTPSHSMPDVEHDMAGGH